MPATIAIPDFSGHPVDFGRFERNVLEIGASVDCGYENGVHGLIMSAEQYEEFYHAAFVPIVRVTQADVPKLNGTSTRADIAVANAVQVRLNEFKASEVAWKSFRSAIIAALPVDLQNSLRDGGESFHLTLTELWQRLKAMFPIDANILRLHRENCSIVYKRGDNLEALLAKHADAHSVYKQAKSLMPPSDQVDYLLNALIPCSLFTIQISNFETQNNVLEKRTFANLAGPVKAYYRSAAFATASAQGYATANAVMSTTSAIPTTVASNALLPSDRPTYEQLVALLANAQLAAASNLSAPSQGSNARRNNNSNRRALATQPPVGTGGPRVHYCFTHGPRQNHTSRQCIHPCTDHKEHATDTNRMGGRD